MIYERNIIEIDLLHFRRFFWLFRVKVVGFVAYVLRVWSHYELLAVAVIEYCLRNTFEIKISGGKLPAGYDLRVKVVFIKN
jgi:hypothetical protein